MTIHKKARLTLIQRQEIFDKYFNKGWEFTTYKDNTGHQGRIKTDNIPSAWKRQEQGFRYSQKY